MKKFILFCIVQLIISTINFLCFKYLGIYSNSQGLDLQIISMIQALAIVLFIKE